MTMLISLIALAVLATVVTLVLGIGSMVHGGSYDTRHATQFMFARVGFQGLAIIFLIIAFFVSV